MSTNEVLMISNKPGEVIVKGFTMSRSYKHTPVFKAGGKKKYAK